LVVILFIFLYDEGVGRKSVTILVLACLLVGGVAGGVFWYLKHQRTVISDLAVEKSGNLPLELAVDFDPTVNSPKFMIESVDRKVKTFDLKSVFPPTFEGKRLTSRITCQEIKIVGPGDSVGEEVVYDVLMERMEGVSKEMMIFSGLCSDNTCAEIHQSCRLYLAKVAP